jgi:hypothetical protein
MALFLKYNTTPKICRTEKKKKKKKKKRRRITYLRIITAIIAWMRIVKNGADVDIYK